MRLYLNDFKEFPLLWSVDQGTLETEQKFTQVHLFDVSGKTKFMLDAPEGWPKCWLEVNGELVTYSDGSAQIQRHAND